LSETTSSTAARCSRLPGFHRLTPSERLDAVAAFSGVDRIELDSLSTTDGLPSEVAAAMSESVVGRFSLPLSFATNFRVNGRDYMVPMAIEEASVVAGSSNAARLLRGGEGICARATEPIMIGQIHFPDPPPEPLLEEAVERHKEELGAHLDSRDPGLVAAGGGFRGVRIRRLSDPDDRPIAVLHFLVDVRDAMGANAINSMAEAAAPLLEQWTGARVGLRILSNLPIHRRVAVTGRVPIGGDGMDRAQAERIEEASRFAEADPYRAVTANKGVMNGIDAVLIATGQDFRAVEAAAHAFAAKEGRYTSLVRWRAGEACLEGTMDMPLALGTVGGVTAVHPTVRTNLRVIAANGARELAELVAAVGLAQNLAATRALANEGIQSGHMRLHARNVAMAAGAGPEEVPAVVSAMLAKDRIDSDTALGCLEALREPGSGDALEEDEAEQ
jgi:hydroxymethylglutaryl-CoA reductase